MARYQAEVTKLEELAPHVVQLTVDVDDPAFTFKPGQWVNFRFQSGIARAYTIASAPEDGPVIQLCVRTGSGKGSVALTQLETGARVSVDGPFGDFVVPEDGAGSLILLAGDTGIAPVRSIVLHLLARKDPRRMTVLYEPDHRYILYASDFDPLARSGAIVHESGRIGTLVSRKRNAWPGATVMVAGFDDFLSRAREALEDCGVDWSKVISESFGPEP